MAEAHGENWAVVFADLVHQMLTDLGEGLNNALFVFMHNESNRIFAKALALVVLGAGRL